MKDSLPNMDEVVRQPAVDKAKLLESIRLNIDYYRTLKQSSKTSSEELYSVGRMDSYSILVRAIESGELDSESHRLLIEEREQLILSANDWEDEYMKLKRSFEELDKSALKTIVLLNESGALKAEQDKEIQSYAV